MTASGGPSELRSDSPDVTEGYGAALGAALRAGDLVVLEGPLGAGKTCLVRGMVAGVGGDGTAVRSPTFVLHQPHRGGFITVHHVDLYRLGAGASIDVLDFDSLLGDGAAVVEWGGYADLHAFHPTTVSIDGGLGQNDRLLRMEPGAAGHLDSAWSALMQRDVAQ